MPTLRSHTHLQAAQADTQAEACKRVCLPNLTTANKAYCRKEKLKLSLGFAKLVVQYFTVINVVKIATFA